MVSVIMPYFNASATLYKAAQSILQQTMRNFELLLINNASTDNSLDIAKQLAAEDTRVVLLHEPKQGVVFAHNTGIQYAKYDLFARMDADDYALPHRLEKQVKLFEEQPQLGLVATQVAGENTQGGFQKYIAWQNSLCQQTDIELARFVESPLANPTVMVRRSVVDQFGSYQEGDFPEDYELFLRYMHNQVAMHKIEEVLLHWNDTPDRLTRTDKRYSQDAFYRTKTEYLIPWLKKHNSFYPKIVVWGSGEKSRKRAALLHEKGIEIEFYVDIDCKNKKDCCHFSSIHAPGKYFIVSYVSNWGARDKIREFLCSKNFVEGVDFILAS